MGAPHRDPAASVNAAAAQPQPISGLSLEEHECLARVSRTYNESQSVEYAPCGKAFAVALDHLGSPEVDAFMSECVEGVVGIFLDQTAQSVQVRLLHNFTVVLQGSCKLILHDLKTNHRTRYLVILARLMNPDMVFYATPDIVDADLSPREAIRKSRGFKVREIVVKTFNDEGGFDILEQLMIGTIPLQSPLGTANAEANGDLKGQAVAPPPPPPSAPAAEPSLSAQDVFLLLDPFAQAQDLIGRPRAEMACRAAMQAIEHMDEEALKSQRTADLAKLRKALKTVLGDDDRLREFLRSLALRTFTSRAFQLRKLGLDLIGELVTESQHADARANAEERLQAVTTGGELTGAVFDVKSMCDWLVDNEVLEKLFGSTDALHPALVGRSQRLLEFMGRGAAMQEKHVDLMFKCCVGHHDSVRGAVQSLLAELAVDHDVAPATAAYILRCASRLVDDHRGDMLFFIEKLMSCGTASSGFQSNLSLCDGSVLHALLDLLWRLLETTTDLGSPRRKQLVDFVVEVLRMPNACMLRARYVVTYIDILQASSRDAQDAKPETASQAVRISTAYELLQKIIKMFDVVQVKTKTALYPGTNTKISLGAYEPGVVAGKHPGIASDYSVFSGFDASAHVVGAPAPPDEIAAAADADPADNEADASLIVKDDEEGTRQLRTQSELILELQTRYHLLELIVEEIKAHCKRTSKSVKVTREQLLTHMQTLQIRLDFLRYCVSRSRLTLKFELVHQLWEALAQPLEREICMVWLRRVAVVDNELCPGLSTDVTNQVFSQLLCGDMEFKQLSEPGFMCFSAFFLDVNRAEDILDGEVLNPASDSEASAEYISSTILNTHVRAADEEEQSVAAASDLASPSNAEESSQAAGAQAEPKKIARHRSSVFADFNPSRPRASSGTDASAAGPPGLAGKSPGGGLSPSSLASARMPSFAAASAPVKPGGTSGDIRISVVRQPGVMGIDTLWRIVETAPEATSARAMDLLLQVQCRVEALGSGDAAALPGRDAEIDVIGELEPDTGDAGVIVDLKTGIERRVEFLDRTFALLEESATAKNPGVSAGTARVQRCIRLITSYLHAFPQTARLVPHAPPRGAELHLQVHHDKILLFSKRDVGKALQINVGGSVTSQIRRAQAARYLHGIILDFDESTGEHVIWLVDGSRIRRDMAAMHTLELGIKGSAENTYQMVSRASSLTPPKLPVQPSVGVIVDEDVEQAAHSYRALLLHVREKHTLGTLQQMIIDELVGPDQSYCPLDQRTITLSVQIYHKAQRSMGHNQQPSQFASRGMDFGHERVLIGVQNTLDEILPDADQAADVDRTPVSRIVRHVINVDIDATAEEDGPISEVNQDAELPSKLITTEGSKYVSMLMRLLDSPSISNTTRVELWELLQTLPTDQGMLRRLSEASADWSEELCANGPYMLRAVYVLMIVNRLIGNSESRASADDLGEPESGGDRDKALGAGAASRAWRSYFFQTEGFQEVVRLLGRILADSSGTSGVEQSWFWVWQQSIALPVVMRIVRFCVRGSLGEAQDQQQQQQQRASPRIERIRFDDSEQSRGMAFSPASRQSISRQSDLQTLAGNLSVLIVLAHRATCAQSGIAAPAPDRTIDASSNGDTSVEEIPIPLLSEETVEEDDDDDGVDDATEAGGFVEDELSSVLNWGGNTTRGERENNGSAKASESDNAMLEVLVDAVQTSFILLQANKDLGSDFLASQTRQQTTFKKTWVGAFSVVDVLALSRFSVVREMLRELLSILCSSSEKNRRAVESLAHEALYTTPRNCPTCDDYFSFVRHQISCGQFRVERFSRLVVARLVQYPPLSRQQIRREAKLLSPFPAALRGQAFKPPPAKARRVAPNEESPEYITVKTAVLMLLDNTLIGYLDLMQLILQEDDKVCEDDSLAVPLMETIFYRFLMAVPSATKKRASAIASLPDVRSRAFDLLKCMAQSADRCLRWLVDASSKFVLETPVPVKQGKFDWTFKPVDFRKSPSGFVGLVNQGATCYQNSVLQQLFMAPALRDWILHAPGVLGTIVSSGSKARRRGPGDEEDVDDFDDDFDDDGSAEYLWNDIPGMRDSKKNRLLRALQYTFTFLKHSDKRFFNPRGFVNESAGLKLMDGHLSQNDAAEFFSRLVDYLEETTQGKMQCKALQDMLYVRTCTMNVRNCEGKHRTESEVGTPFLTLNVRSGMAGPTLHSLDDALESWFKAEKLSGLECEVCNTKDKERRFEADQVKCFSKLPPVLVVQLQRFDFDYEIMQPTKLNHRVSFEHRIDLYRFTRAAVMEKFDEGAKDPAAEATAATAAASSSEEGRAGRASPAPQHVASGSASGNDGEAEEEEVVAVGAAGEGASKPKPQTVYELSGVVVHQGSGANFGHYYSFIKDRRSGAWFRFDDERVTPFDVRNLEEECFGGPGSQGNWGSNAGGGSGMGGIGLGGMSKFKQYGARDNNAYLLLYELENAPREGVLTAREPKLAMPKAPAVTFSDAEELAPSSALGFASAGWLVCRAQVWLRQARLALTAKRRLKKIEMDVWEDNQRTLRHGLVMVPMFMTFCLDLLQIQTTDESALEATAKMGLTVYTRATLRIHSQKSRLRLWDSKLREALRRSVDIAPNVIPWFLEAVCKPDIRQDTLEPLLQHCGDERTRIQAVSLMREVITLAVKTAWRSEGAEVEALPRPDVERALVNFVSVMRELMPSEPVSCKHMWPYFSVWQRLCAAAPLRDLLLDQGLASLLLRAYQLADPALRSSARNRAGSFDVIGQHPHHQQQVNGMGGLSDGDFTSLLNALTLLLTGSTSDQAYRRLTRLSGYYEDPVPVDDQDQGADDTDDEEEAGPGAVNTTGGLGDGLSSGTLHWFLQQARTARALRFARGMPSKGNMLGAAMNLPEAVVLGIARRDPRPGALLLAQACKGDLKLSQNVIRELQNYLETSMNLLDMPHSTVESICRRIKAFSMALCTVGSIDDGHVHERSRELVSICLRQMIEMHKEAKRLKAQQEAQRSGTRYSQSIYFDSEAEDMFQLNVYAVYRLAKTLGQLYLVNAGVRHWMNEYQQHWVQWVPAWLDQHSYERALGGNSDVFTRAVGTGCTVRLLMRAAAMANTDFRYNPIVPQKVSIVVKGAGTPECNGTFVFDGFFKPGESNQIDSVTPKFVKFVKGRPYSLYRCQVKDKQYTWYISELSAKPGTNSDTDYYSSHQGNPSNMPPDGGWTACGQGAKPAPAHVRIVCTKFEPEDDPCEALELREQIANRRQAAASARASRAGSTSSSQAASAGGVGSAPAAGGAAGVARALGAAAPGQPPVTAALEEPTSGVPMRPEASLGQGEVASRAPPRPDSAFDAGAEGDDEGEDGDDEGEDDVEDPESLLPSGSGSAILDAFGRVNGDDDDDVFDAASDRAVNSGGDDSDDERDNLSTASGSGSDHNPHPSPLQPGPL